MVWKHIIDTLYTLYELDFEGINQIRQATTNTGFLFIGTI